MAPNSSTVDDLLRPGRRGRTATRGSGTGSRSRRTGRTRPPGGSPGAGRCCRRPARRRGPSAPPGSTGRRSRTRRSRRPPGSPRPGRRPARPEATAAPSRGRRTRGRRSAPWERAHPPPRAGRRASENPRQVPSLLADRSTALAESNLPPEPGRRRGHGHRAMRGVIHTEFNLADMFECVADEVSGREAVSCGDRPPYLSPPSIERTNRLAHGLRRLGISPGRARRHLRVQLRRVRGSDARLLTRSARFRSTSTSATPATSSRTSSTTATSRALVFQPDPSPHGRVPPDPVTPKLRSLIVVEDGSGADISGVECTPYEEVVETGSASATSPAGPPTTTTSSTRGEPPACRGGSCGARRTSSSRRSAVETPAGPRSPGPEEIGQTVHTNRAQRATPFLPPGDPGPDEFVNLTLGPLVHASGQWSALGSLLAGGKAVAVPPAEHGHGARPRPGRAGAGDDADASSVTPAAGRCSTSPAARRRGARHVLAPAPRIGRQHPLRRRQGRPARAAADRAGDQRGGGLVGVTGAGGRHRRSARATPSPVACSSRPSRA